LIDGLNNKQVKCADALCRKCEQNSASCLGCGFANYFERIGSTNFLKCHFVIPEKYGLVEEGNKRVRPCRDLECLECPQDFKICMKCQQPKYLEFNQEWSDGSANPQFFSSKAKCRTCKISEGFFIDEPYCRPCHSSCKLAI
jgi:hypothetical protein